MRRLCLVVLLVWGCDEGGEASADAATPDAVTADAGATDAAAEAEPDSTPDSGPPPWALSTAVEPTMPPEYYVQQAEIYFDTLDTRADPEIVPNYSVLVARWEWPPWLYLTGYGDEQMIETTRAALILDESTVEDRDCRFFEEQPFARCYVSFVYEEGRCPIYEEFTFSHTGEMNFIEAWSDLPGLLPFADDADRWGEGEVNRLSTKVPGLGNPEGLIDIEAEWMIAAADADEDIAELIKRAAMFWTYWIMAVQEAGDDIYARGCGW